MATTISVSKELLSALKERKLYDKESYEKVIWDAVRRLMELSEETKNKTKELKAPDSFIELSYNSTLEGSKTKEFFSSK